ncbi:MAG: DNA gyrase inhibitor YacG, partial [Gammaproteobacteria bacterium]|nr:DNA gyrase inhibitor YacG [Gammaproteobacteria bacterium]
MKTCPTCNKEFDPKNLSENLPFCSERCRLVDLGAWLTEKHRIPDDE